MGDYNLDVVKTAGYSCYLDEYPKKKKKTQPLFNTPKKSGTQKFLDKILEISKLNYEKESKNIGKENIR